MRHIRQPEGSNLCGQSCAAMLGNMTIYEAIELLGTEGCTTTKNMAGALRALGFKCKDKLKRTANNGVVPPYSMCLVHVVFDEPRRTHWIIWRGDEQLFYDPNFPNPVSEDFYYEKGGRITSYLEITKEAD